jgi:hypothetical protein
MNRLPAIAGSDAKNMPVLKVLLLVVTHEDSQLLKFALENVVRESPNHFGFCCDLRAER